MSALAWVAVVVVALLFAGYALLLRYARGTYRDMPDRPEDDK